MTDAQKKEQQDAFWKTAKEAGAVSGDEYSPRRIGGDQKTTNLILDVILKGEKTGTFGLEALHERMPETKPFVGQYFVLLDGDDQPSAVIQTTDLKPIRYGDITQDDLAIEGPGARQIDVWQKIHQPYWERLLEPHGLKADDDMVVVMEKFEVVYRA